MTSIAPGDVVTQDGTVSTTDSIEIDGGPGLGYPVFSPGGSYINNGTLTADGTFLVDGGFVGTVTGGGGAGGQLTNNGVLLNAGMITLAGRVAGTQGTGGAPGSGGNLLNVGQLTNSGTIELAAGASGVSGGSGGSLTNQGTLLNLGTIEIDGGAGSPYAGGNVGVPGVLSDSGVFTNQGLITIGAGGDSGTGQVVAGGRGGTLSATGTLTNAGTILVATGGHYGLPGNANPGYGGVMTLTGTLVNSGSLDVGGQTFSSNLGSLNATTIVDTGMLSVEGILQTTTLDIGAGGVVNETATGSLTASTVILRAGGELDLGGSYGAMSVQSAGRLVIGGSFVANKITFSSLGAGTGIQLAGVDITAAQFSGGYLVLSTAGGVTAAYYAVSSDTSGESLSISQGSDGFNDLITVNCFLAGTKLRTTGGEVAVEDLRPGCEMRVGVDGARTAAVRWIGRRRIDLARHRDPDAVRPIRVVAHAMAPGVPCRDLWLSPDHAVLCDGVLIPIRLLVNHATIAPDPQLRHAAYFHVEFDRHDILLAEGLAAESYLDTGDRGGFANADVVTLFPPTATRLPDGATAPRCAPLAVQPAVVEPIWRVLAERATDLGYTRPSAVRTADPSLHLLIDSQAISPSLVVDGRHVFVLPPGETRRACVASRAARPADALPWLDDRRHLGVAVSRIVVLGEGGAEAVDLEDPALGRGWWPIEAEGARSWRWTDGQAVLALPRGARFLDIHVTGLLDYAMDTRRVPAQIAV